MSSIKTRFSKNLKVQRKKKNITQEQLAEALGISVRYIQLLESKSPPNVKLETLETLAKALKIKPAELLQ